METPDPLPPRWASASETIKDLIDGGESMLLAKTLPEGVSSRVGLERFAREYCKVHEQADLALIYAILGVTTSIAAQGGYVLSTPLPGGEWLEVPAIQMVLGVAPSGSGKSTSLKVGTKILDRVLAAALSDRRRRLPVMRNDAVAQYERDREDETLAADPKQFQEVFDAGLCPKTVVSDPTQEALRNWAVTNGGHVGVIAGEADIFRSASAYSADGTANYTMVLNAWDQGKIDTARVSNTDLQIDKASIPLCVLFQTEVFAEVTSGNTRGMGGSGDTFVAKGMFGRMWVVEIDQIEDYSKIARLYSDDNDFDNDHDDPDGYRDTDGNTTDLGSAAIDFELALRDIAMDTNQYRIDKAVHRSWHITATKYGTEMMVPEIPEPERTVILLDAEGRLAYRRLQRMMADIQQHVQDQRDEDLKNLWMPMASRITQHVLREALIVTLAAGRTSNEPFKVTAEIIEDAACRILPWRWCYSANALTRRANERAEDLLAMSSLQLNPQAKDLTAPSMIRDLLKTLASEDKRLSNPGIRLSDLTERVRSRLPREKRGQVSTLLKKTLPELCSDPDSGITEQEGPPGIAGRVTKTYRISSSAQVF